MPKREGLILRGRAAVRAGLIRQPLDNSYEACMEESRLVMLTCAKGAMKAARIEPRMARAPCACLWCLGVDAVLLTLQESRSAVCGN